jgi:hypothetical protein
MTSLAILMFFMFALRVRLAPGARFYRMGNYWLRTILSIYSIAEDVHIVSSAPPPHHAALWELALEFLMPPPSMKNGLPPSPKAVARHQELRQP